MASTDVTETPPPLSKEPSLEPALGPAIEEEHASGQAPQPHVGYDRPVPPGTFALPPLFDLFTYLNYYAFLFFFRRFSFLLF